MKQSTETRKLKSPDGTIAYYCDGKMHNWEGPALIPGGDAKKAEYYIHGIKYSKDAWEAAKKDWNGQPFHKTAAGKQMGTRV
jgi:hypothetical protein